MWTESCLFRSGLLHWVWLDGTFWTRTAAYVLTLPPIQLQHQASWSGMLPFSMSFAVFPEGSQIVALPRGSKRYIRQVIERLPIETNRRQQALSNVMKMWAIGWNVATPRPGTLNTVHLAISRDCRSPQLAVSWCVHIYLSKGRRQ